MDLCTGDLPLRDMATDTKPRSAIGSQIAGRRVASLIATRHHTLLEIGHEIISTAILLRADSRRAVVS